MSETVIEKRFHIQGTPDKEHIEMGSTKFNYVKAYVDYDLGGTSMFTYKTRPRGYYMNIRKTTIGADTYGEWEAFGLLVGNAKDRICILLEECARKSKKREQAAVDYFNKNLDSIIKKEFPDLVLEAG